VGYGVQEAGFWISNLKLRVQGAGSTVGYGVGGRQLGTGFGDQVLEVDCKGHLVQIQGSGFRGLGFRV
jgi:hypothetical protein